jgi:hypothetical protein
VSSKSTEACRTDSTWIAFKRLDTGRARFVIDGPIAYVSARCLTESSGRLNAARGRDAPRLRFCRWVFRFDSPIAFQFDCTLPSGGSAGADHPDEKGDVEQSDYRQLKARRGR